MLTMDLSVTELEILSACLEFGLGYVHKSTRIVPNEYKTIIQDYEKQLSVLNDKICIELKNMDNKN